MSCSYLLARYNHGHGHDLVIFQVQTITAEHTEVVWTSSLKVS